MAREVLNLTKRKSLVSRSGHFCELGQTKGFRMQLQFILVIKNADE